MSGGRWVAAHVLAIAMGTGCVGCAVDNPLFGLSDGEDGGFGTTDAEDSGADDGLTDALTDGVATQGDPDGGDQDPDGTAGDDATANGDDPGDDDDDAADDGDTDGGLDRGLDGGEDTGPPALDDDGGGSDDGDELACPDAITLFAGATFTGRIEVDGMLGYQAAQAHCEARADILAPGKCQDVVFAVLREGPAQNGAVDFASFLGVVYDTPVRGPNGTVVVHDAVDFFDGDLQNTLWEAGVFHRHTHVWNGFDPDQFQGNCDDWTTDAGVMSGGVGDSAYYYKWSATGDFGCNTVQPILCACW